MFYNVFIVLNYCFYNIIKIQKDITEKAYLVVLPGLAGADAYHHKIDKITYFK